ncbi:hypothetical protein KI387_013833, partial [Taxus chinensis]
MVLLGDPDFIPTKYYNIWHSFKVAILYHIWKSRNDVIFNKEVVDRIFTISNKLAVISNVSLQIQVQVEKVHIEVEHLQTLLDHWGSAPYAVSHVPPDSPCRRSRLQGRCSSQGRRNFNWGPARGRCSASPHWRLSLPPSWTPPASRVFGRLGSDSGSSGSILKRRRGEGFQSQDNNCMQEGGVHFESESFDKEGIQQDDIVIQYFITNKETSIEIVGEKAHGDGAKKIIKDQPCGQEIVVNQDPEKNGKQVVRIAFLATGTSMECISSAFSKTSVSLRPRHEGSHSKTSFSRAVKVRCAAAPRTYKITLLPGDGIGPEITSVAKDVLRLVGSQLAINFKFTETLVGGAAIDATGVPLPNETLVACKESDAVLLAAIGGFCVTGTTCMLVIEYFFFILGQLADSSTLKRDVAEGVDIMVVRELTGGIYFGEPKGFGINEKGERIGFNTEVYSTSEVDRIARVAFEIARKRGGKLCSVDKANVLEASQLWRERVTAIGNNYPDIQLSHMYVDNASMQLIRNPKQFDTIVTNNIFGDILSDEASMLTGSIGMLPSASVGDL